MIFIFNELYIGLYLFVVNIYNLISVNSHKHRLWLFIIRLIISVYLIMGYMGFITNSAYTTQYQHTHGKYPQR